MAKVSICIPAYNNAEKITRLLESIQMQEYKDYEVIVTDDSEGDGVARVVKGYEFAAYYHNAERRGPTANCNEAVMKSTGSFIKVMHHDDWFTTSHSLFRLVEALEREPDAALAFCATVQVNGGRQYERCISDQDLHRYERDYRTVFIRNQIGAPSAVIYRRPDGAEALFDEKLMWLVDSELYLRLLERGGKLVSVPEHLVSIGMDADQVTNTCMEDRQLQAREYEYVFLKHRLYRQKECRRFYTRKMLLLGQERYLETNRKYLKISEILFEKIRVKRQNGK